jgi:uncharacterized protein (TIGR02145 family)
MKNKSLVVISILASAIVLTTCGKTLKTVKIGDQIWMAENLITTKYNDGTAIPLINDGATWAGLTTPGYCWYNNDEATNKNSYGALYNWYAVNTGKLCPKGWHIATEAELTNLESYLGGSGGGGKLKETGTIHWLNPNTGATNETGFTALPGGCRVFDGKFDRIGIDGLWWSSTECSPKYARNWSLSNINSIFNSDCSSEKSFGHSVRCVQDYSNKSNQSI